MEPVKEHLPTIRPFSHSVNLLEYSDGRLLATWYSGTREGSEDQIAVASMLDSSTGKWSEPTVTLRQFQYDGDYWVPEETCPIETDDGATVMYTWAAPLSSFRLRERHPSVIGGDGYKQTVIGTITYGRKLWVRDISESHLFRFRLEGKKAVGIECLSGRDGFLEQGIVFWGQAVLRDASLGPAGGWLIPCHTQRQPLCHSRVLMVAGDGMSVVSNEVDLYEPPGCLEPALAQLPDGRWLCYMRYGGVGGFVWRSQSSDGGRTFSHPVLTNLRNPHSAVDIAVGQSGRLLILYNDSHRLRTPLTLGVSEDEGATFRTRDIEIGEGEFSYPKLHQTRDGVWRAMYSDQCLSIVEVRFDEEWLLGGRKVIGL